MQLGIDSEFFHKSQAVIEGGKALTRSDITENKPEKAVLGLDHLDGIIIDHNTSREMTSARELGSATHDLADVIKDRMDDMKMESSSSDFTDKPKAMDAIDKKGNQQRSMT